MNLVGKIFVVLIFVMSLVFMSFAVMVYGTRTNWREKVVGPDGLQAQYAALKKQNEELENTLNERAAEWNAERAALAQAAAKNETYYKMLQAEHDTAVTENQQNRQALSEATAALKVAQENLSKIKDEVAQLRDRIKDAETDRNTSFAEATKAMDDLNNALNKLDLLQARNDELVQQIATLKDKIARGGVPGVAPKINGVVTALGGNDLVEVSIGSDDGIEVGHELDVHRNGKYLGRVRIVRTSPDKAVAQVIKSYEQGIIQRGDNVTAVRQA